MKDSFDEERYKIINGDSLKLLDTFEDNYFDSCVTDPPYGLTTITKRFGKENSAPAQYGNDGSFAILSKGFMGKEWDGSGIEYNVEFWKKVYRVLKPGSFLLAFGGSRTFYRIACAIEDAGFEIRGTIMWLYGSGFPKSLNIGLAIDKKNGIESIDTGIVSPNARPNCDKTNTLYESGTVGKNFTIKRATNEWAGWGTALKPAYEPIIVARKPVEKSVVDNVQKYGVGGINIDECRVDYNGEIPNVGGRAKHDRGEGYGFKPLEDECVANPNGRFPANVILTYDDTDFDEVCGGMPNTKSNGGNSTMPDLDYVGKEQSKLGNGHKMSFGQVENAPRKQSDYIAPDDEGNACRYFYCAKASKKDRDSGLDQLESRISNDGRKTPIDNAFQRGDTLRKNIHPTVKPVELMQYLVRLVTPNGGKILDPFNGSGSTGKAVAFENRESDKDYSYVGIELDKEYCEISKGRIDYALNKYEYDMIQDIKREEERTGQLSLFDFGEDL